MWLERRTRAIFRRAEFGFFGVIVRTIVQTPRFWGAPFRSCTNRRSSEFHVVRSAGVSTFGFWLFRPFRTSCEIVGMRRTPSCVERARTHASHCPRFLTTPPTRAPALRRRPPAQRDRCHKKRLADARNDRPTPLGKAVTVSKDSRIESMTGGPVARQRGRFRKLGDSVGPHRTAAGVPARFRRLVAPSPDRWMLSRPKTEG